MNDRERGMSIHEYLSINPPKPFMPGARYHPDEDAIVCWFKSDVARAKQMSESVTLYLSEKTSDVTGLKIVNVGQIKIEGLP